jgi:sugar/nucleoside kinase (ribokinase family)
MNRNNTVYCIGGANLEQIISVEYSPVFGAKHDVREQMVSAGGSGLSQSCRLLSMGFQAVPLLPVGEDESGGKAIEVLRTSLAKGDSSSESNFDYLVQKGKSTSSSVVIIDPLGRRTIFTSEGTATKSFEEWLFRHLDRLQRPPDAVIVGHIAADDDGDITRRIVNRFAEEGAYVLMNMGRTQYEQGPDPFLEILGKVDCLQFEFGEAKRFVLSHIGTQSPSLEEVLKWLVSRASPRSVVLTLSEAGAVAWHQDAADEVLIAWPYDLEGIMRDSTGAGDAFAAGLASAMIGFDRGVHQFQNALVRARNWAAYACTTLGGAHGSPTQEELHKFVDKHQERVLRVPERRSWDEARHILRYFDITRRYSTSNYVRPA